jgi:hypothetical protein
LKEIPMNTGTYPRSPNEEFGYYPSDLEMETALLDLDLSYDLVIEDLDEVATALAPLCACTAPFVDRRPATTGHAPLRGRQALVTC